MTLKIGHDVKDYVKTLKNTLWRQKLRHAIKTIGRI